MGTPSGVVVQARRVATLGVSSRPHLLWRACQHPLIINVTVARASPPAQPSNAVVWVVAIPVLVALVLYLFT